MRLAWCHIAHCSALDGVLPTLLSACAGGSGGRGGGGGSSGSGDADGNGGGFPAPLGWLLIFLVVGAAYYVGNDLPPVPAIRQKLFGSADAAGKR